MPAVTAGRRQGAAGPSGSCRSATSAARRTGGSATCSRRSAEGSTCDSRLRGGQRVLRAGQSHLGLVVLLDQRSLLVVESVQPGSRGVEVGVGGPGLGGGD